MWRRYRAYLEDPPLEVLEWHDRPTGARGWLVINSLRGGAAGGGTRLRRGLDRDEVLHLAKTMELKFAYSGPPVGGAKSGIRFDPADPRRRDVLRRWLEAIRPFLHACYGTGGDLNVDAERDLAPLLAELGFRHLQEGILRGHLGLDAEVGEVCRQIQVGASAPVNGPLGLADGSLTVTDLITGYGVSRAAHHLYRLRGESLEGARVLVEGFGNVGGAVALYLAREGARVVGLVDRESAVVAPEGLGAGEVEALVRRREGGRLPAHPGRRTGAGRSTAYRVPAELFVPAAVSGSVDARRLRDLERAGVRTIVCAANQPFREARVGSTELQEAADASFEIVADTVGSLGMARTYYSLMLRGSSENGAASPAAVFQEVDATIRDAVEEVVERAGDARHGLLAAALDVALDRIGA